MTWSAEKRLALNFLREEQDRLGFFFSFSSPNKDRFQPQKRYLTVFSNALILACLTELGPDQQLEPIKAKLAKFLLSQRHQLGSFNYWAKEEKQRKVLPYPDDFDDTACVLSALYQYQPELVEAGDLAKFVQLLTQYEKQEGGPYTTWLVSGQAGSAWQDVDLAVNSNIGYCLKLLGVKLPNLERLVEKAVANQKLKSPYYPSDYPVIYFISRFYSGSKRSALADMLWERQQANGSWGSPLQTALATLALLNLGQADFDSQLEQGINYLVKNFRSGHWQAAAFCLDPSLNNRAYFSGSAALTTAFCLVALDRYKKLKSIKPSVDLRQRLIYKQIMRLTLQKSSQLGPPLKVPLKKYIGRLADQDLRQEISLLPYFFYNSLGKIKAKVPEDLVVKLGTANIFGWLAYDLYDDIIDAESGSSVLPIANWAHQQLTDIYHSLSLSPAFKGLFQRVLTEMAQAYYWEVINCRFDPKDLQSLKIREGSGATLKSLGHSLGPLAIFDYLGEKPEGVEMQKLIKFFRLYLSSKQLLDDAHDWEEDLRAGRLNPVGRGLLTTYQGALVGQIENFLPQLRQHFWQEQLLTIFQAVDDNLSQGQRLLRQSQLIGQPEQLLAITEPLKRAANRGQRHHYQAAGLIKTFKTYLD